MLLLIALLLGLALVFGGFLVGRSVNDGGCDSHHWGEYESTDDLRGSITNADDSPLSWQNRLRFQVEQRYVAECEHVGCHEETVQWRTEMNFTKSFNNA